MFITLAIPVIVSVIAGLALFLFRNFVPGFEVNKYELGAGIAVALILSLGVSSIGKTMAVDDAVGGYKEFWNGSMTAALSERVPCERDGSCRQTYKCDSYTVVDQAAYTDSDGNYHAEVSHTEWHHCPYATEEYNYWITDSLGDTHELWMGWFSTNPQEWDPGEGLPGGVGRGVPPEWTRLKGLIASGKAPGVTKLNTYTNYLLSSTTSNLKPYSDDVEKYKKLGLLPPHTENWKSPMLNGYAANKVVFAGKVPENAAQWQDALARLNAALGTERQGDMHILVAPASKINNPDSYLNAVLAYWQGRDFGKSALGKNGIVVVVGLNQNGSRVQWVRSKTGMPTGNGEMTTALNIISDVSSDPYKLIGNTNSRWDGKEIKYTLSGGTIETVVMKEHPFLRACMECKDKTDHGESYVYLKKDVKVTGWAKFWIIMISLFMNAAVWGLLWYLPLFEYPSSQDGTRKSIRTPWGNRLNDW